MNTDGIELGCLGMEKEGWFDPWSLLNLMKRGATDLGTRFVHGEVTNFLFTETNVSVSGDEENTQYTGSNEVVVSDFLFYFLMIWKGMSTKQYIST